MMAEMPEFRLSLFLGVLSEFYLRVVHFLTFAKKIDYGANKRHFRACFGF